MSRRAITPATYAALTASFRVHVGRTTVVANAVGVVQRTAKKAWETGFGPEMPSIRDVFEQEQIKARALAQQAEENRHKEALRTHKDASAHAAAALAQEAQMIALSRGGSLSALGAGATLSISARELAGLIKSRVETAVKLPTEASGALTIAEALALLQRATTIMSQINAMAHETMQMERLHLGEPAHVVQVTLDAREMSEVEQRVRIENAKSAIDRLHRQLSGESRPLIGQRVLPE